MSETEIVAIIAAILLASRQGPSEKFKGFLDVEHSMAVSEAMSILSMAKRRAE